MDRIIKVKAVQRKETCSWLRWGKDARTVEVILDDTPTTRTSALLESLGADRAVFFRASCNEAEPFLLARGIS